MNIAEEFLIESLDHYQDYLSSSGSNDLILENNLENKEFIDFVFKYGVTYNLWDEGSPPIYKNEKIYWYDFMLIAYFRHAIRNGNLNLQ